MAGTMADSRLEAGEKPTVEHVTTNDIDADIDADIEAPEARGVEADNIPDAYWLSFRFLGSCASVVLLAVSLYISFSLPASAITVINNSLGPSPSYIWISDAGGIICGVGLLIVGRVGDIVGRRWFLIVGQVVGVAGSVICAKATSINMLIAGSAIYGVASTTQLTFPYIIQELVPNKHRGIVQGVMIIGVLPFAGFGSLIAREFINNPNLGWRWCYWLNVVFNGAALILLVLCYFPPTLHQMHAQLTWQKELKKLDWGGMFFFTAGQVLILLALNWGGSSYPWSSAHIVAPLVLGVAMIVAFVLYEVYVPLEQPLLPIRLLKNVPYVAIVVVAAAGQMVFTSLSILWPEQIEYLYTTDNIKIGWMAITSGLALALAEIVIGPLLKAVGHVRLQLIVATIILTAFLGGLAGATQHTEAMAIAFTTLAGFSSGWMDVITLVANGLVTDPADLGLANGFMGSVKQTIGAISVSIFIAVLQSRVATNMPKDIGAAAVAAGLPSSSVEAAIAAVANGTAAALDAVPGMTSVIEAAIGDGVKTAYASSFKIVYLVALAFSAIAVIASFFTADIDKQMNNYVSRRIGGTVATTDVPKDVTIQHNAHVTELH
ncbi:hypothetical protein Sste5346_008872 [Sporothrix stenoceras]|uniref:Major facilitator superfamily (MFS) profile domain-containing protein n=1 Tax=Sporothrix stenoceras TaxID=5173 RepID=A0ABR3YMC9_9PEZI